MTWKSIFTLLVLQMRSRLAAMGQSKHLIALLSVHLFRYLGLIALLPGIFDLSSLGFTRSYLAQVAYGDFIAGLLAIASIVAILRQWKYTIPLIWFFNIFGFLDLANAGISMAPKIQDPNILGGLGWSIFTVYLPAVIVSHIAIFILLLKQPQFKYWGDRSTHHTTKKQENQS
jgi:hypothetical protein